MRVRAPTALAGTRFLAAARATRRRRGRVDAPAHVVTALVVEAAIVGARVALLGAHVLTRELHQLAAVAHFDLRRADARDLSFGTRRRGTISATGERAAGSTAGRADRAVGEDR